jgi:hypothetical protein
MLEKRRIGNLGEKGLGQMMLPTRNLFGRIQMETDDDRVGKIRSTLMSHHPQERKVQVNLQ